MAQRLGKCHGQGPVDNLFGRVRGWINAFLQCSGPIHGTQDLVNCYQARDASMRAVDPGRSICIFRSEPGRREANHETFSTFEGLADQPHIFSSGYAVSCTR